MGLFSVLRAVAPIAKHSAGIPLAPITGLVRSVAPGFGVGSKDFSDQSDEHISGRPGAVRYATDDPKIRHKGFKGWLEHQGQRARDLGGLTSEYADLGLAKTVEAVAIADRLTDPLEYGVAGLSHGVQSLGHSGVSELAGATASGLRGAEAFWDGLAGRDHTDDHSDWGSAFADLSRKQAKKAADDAMMGDAYMASSGQVSQSAIRSIKDMEFDDSFLWGTDAESRLRDLGLVSAGAIAGAGLAGNKADAEAKEAALKLDEVTYRDMVASESRQTEDSDDPSAPSSPPWVGRDPFPQVPDFSNDPDGATAPESFPGAPPLKGASGAMGKEIRKRSNR